MGRARASILLVLGAMTLAASCSSADPMSDAVLAECTGAARAGGTIGGSAVLLPNVALRLPSEAMAPEGSSTDDVEAAFEAAFSDVYGMGVDEFLALRDDADETTTALLGEPPGVGENVSNEWFVERDAELMRLWNERHPEGAAAYCEFVASETGTAP